MAMRNPSPSRPIRFAAGTRQSSKMTAAVGWLFQPSFFSFLPNLSPGVPFSTSRHDTPPAPAPPVRHITMYTSTQLPHSLHPACAAATNKECHKRTKQNQRECGRGKAHARGGRGGELKKQMR
jgi:hypothetical protein